MKRNLLQILFKTNAFVVLAGPEEILIEDKILLILTGITRSMRLGDVRVKMYVLSSLDKNRTKVTIQYISDSSEISNKGLGI